jgi:hypothetical protein
VDTVESVRVFSSGVIGRSSGVQEFGSCRIEEPFSPLVGTVKSVRVFFSGVRGRSSGVQKFRSCRIERPFSALVKHRGIRASFLLRRHRKEFRSSGVAE